jgi:hypothetical protein
MHSSGEIINSQVRHGPLLERLHPLSDAHKLHLPLFAPRSGESDRRCQVFKLPARSVL